MQDFLTSCVVALYRQCNSATALDEIATTDATKVQQKSLKALAEQVIGRNQRNQPRNSFATMQLHSGMSKKEICNQSSSKLKGLIKKVSDKYGGDSEGFVGEYTMGILKETSIEKAIDCFEQLAKGLY